MFAALGLQRARVRAVTVRVSGLTSVSSTAVQLTFDRAVEDARRLEPIIDRAARRFGSGIVRPAVLLGNRT
ncbi:hypothetical protein QBC98_005455 [Kitasatospora acidiphila]